MIAAARPFKHFISAAAQVPLVGDVAAGAYRRYFNSVGGTARLFCGIFPDFASAERAVPENRLVGYDNAPSAERIMDEWLEVFPSDYPVMFWLEKLLRECRTVFDWGGNAAIKYFAFRPYLLYPEGLKWFVNDVPAVLKRGEEIALRERSLGLHFTPSMDELARADVLLASGSVQFVPDPQAALSQSPTLPDHLIFNKVPLYDMPSAVTLQNMGTALCPYHLFNRGEFIAAIEKLGFRLRDEWKTPDVNCYIPFFPEHRIARFSGLYFERTRPAREGRECGTFAASADTNVPGLDASSDGTAGAPNLNRPTP